MWTWRHGDMGTYPISPRGKLGLEPGSAPGVPYMGASVGRIVWCGPASPSPMRDVVCVCGDVDTVCVCASGDLASVCLRGCVCGCSSGADRVSAAAGAVGSIVHSSVGRALSDRPELVRPPPPRRALSDRPDGRIGPVATCTPATAADRGYASLEQSVPDGRTDGRTNSRSDGRPTSVTFHNPADPFQTCLTK